MLPALGENHFFRNLEPNKKIRHGPNQASPATGFHPQTWLSWNGKRVMLASVKPDKRRKSGESSKDSQSTSDSTTRNSKARMPRAAREWRQQARKIAYSLARALRALASAV